MVDATDPDAILRALEWARGLFESGPRKLSPAAYSLAATGPQPWTPPAGHPAWSAAALAHQILALHTWTDQAGELEAAMERAGRDVFIASYRLVVEADGTPRSYTAWVEGVTDALLPRSDRLLMVREGAEPWNVDWDPAITIAGAHLVEDRSFDPPRWHTTGWPPPDVLALLEAHAVQR